MNRYFRLMTLATVELLFTTPLSAYAIYLNATANTLQPWKGFADAHFDYSQIGQFPAVQWRAEHGNVVSLELFRWGLPFCALVFFAFFGFADEARKHYRMAYASIAKHLGLSTGVSSSSSSVSSSIGYVLKYARHCLITDFSLQDIQTSSQGVPYGLRRIPSYLHTSRSAYSQVRLNTIFCDLRFRYQEYIIDIDRLRISRVP